MTNSPMEPGYTYQEWPPIISGHPCDVEGCNEASVKFCLLQMEGGPYLEEYLCDTHGIKEEVVDRFIENMRKRGTLG